MNGILCIHNSGVKKSGMFGKWGHAPSRRAGCAATTRAAGGTSAFDALPFEFGRQSTTIATLCRRLLFPDPLPTHWDSRQASATDWLAIRMSLQCVFISVIPDSPSLAAYIVQLISVSKFSLKPFIFFKQNRRGLHLKLSFLNHIENTTVPYAALRVPSVRSFVRCAVNMLACALRTGFNSLGNKKSI